MCPMNRRWVDGAMPRSRASRMSSPGVTYPVQEHTANRPTSAAATPAAASASPTAALPSGSASVRYRRIRRSVDQPDTFSIVWLIAPCRVTTPELLNSREASARCTPE